MTKRIAAIIHNQSFKDRALTDLPLPVVNVEALATTLLDPEIGNFDEAKIFYDLPTAEFHEIVKDLFHFRKPLDTLLLYIVGPALWAADGQLYLLTWDSTFRSPAETAMPAEAITAWMDRSFARKQILVLDPLLIDARRSKVARQSRSDLTRLTEQDLASAFEGQGYWRIVLGPRVGAHVTLNGNDLQLLSRPDSFTRYFVDGLQSGQADKNGDGMIGIRELCTYVEEKAAVKNSPGGAQWWSYRERNEFFIARKINVPQGFMTRVKWDLLFGAIAVPTTIIVIGSVSDPIGAVNMALFFLGLFVFLYRYRLN